MKILLTGKQTPITIKMQKQGKGLKSSILSIYVSFTNQFPNKIDYDEESTSGTIKASTKGEGKFFKEDYLYITIISEFH